MIIKIQPLFFSVLTVIYLIYLQFSSYRTWCDVLCNFRRCRVKHGKTFTLFSTVIIPIDCYWKNKKNCFFM